MIVTEAAGEPVTELSVDMFNSLIDQLQALHKVGYLHLDVRPSNLVIVGSELMLIDFGCAVKLAEGKFVCKAGQYRGTLRTASTNVLDNACSGVDFELTAKDDLVSACRSVLRLVGKLTFWDLESELHEAGATTEEEQVTRWSKVSAVYNRVSKKHRALAFPFEPTTSRLGSTDYEHVKCLVAEYYPTS